MDASTSVDLYAATRERITAAGHAFGVEQFDRRVPACPEWTVHNLISHLAGVAADFISGNLDGAPRPSDAAPCTLSIVTPDGTYTVGSGTPVAEVETDAYELFRALFGRRSPTQIQSWQWSTPAHAVAWSTELPRLPQTQLPLAD